MVDMNKAVAERIALAEPIRQGLGEADPDDHHDDAAAIEQAESRRRRRHPAI
jgi:hypothetical protein